MARNKQACARSPRETFWKSNATRVVPNVRPNNRAVPSMPLAPPLRRVGAEETMVTLFGVWNSPKPIPQRAIRHTIFQLSGCSGRMSIEWEKSLLQIRPFPFLPTVPDAHALQVVRQEGLSISWPKARESATVRFRRHYNAVHSAWRQGHHCQHLCREWCDGCTDESAKMGIRIKSTGRMGLPALSCRRIKRFLWWREAQFADRWSHGFQNAQSPPKNKSAVRKSVHWLLHWFYRTYVVFRQGGFVAINDGRWQALPVLTGCWWQQPVPASQRQNAAGDGWSGGCRNCNDHGIHSHAATFVADKSVG